MTLPGLLMLKIWWQELLNSYGYYWGLYHLEPQHINFWLCTFHGCVWPLSLPPHSGLTKLQSAKIEMVQKKALAIVLANSYTNYESALLRLNIERLDVRREKLCLSFALKCACSHRFKHMFPLNPTTRSNMRKSKTYMEPKCNTSRFFNSTIPYLARLLRGCTYIT